MFDIYFEDNYGKLYENLPEEKFEVFEYEDDIGKISNRYLKKVIPIKTNDNNTYYDLTTPYGYGGPIIEEINDIDKKNKLIKNYENKFNEYAQKQNIVSEFVRFHPVISNARNFKNVYDISFNRKTVGTNLKYDNPFQTEFSKSTRKRIRKILRNEHISYEIIDRPKTLDDFMEIYYSTMDRNDATDNYYFPKDYFNNMLENIGDFLITAKVYYDETVIGMGVYFKYDKFLHAHLSGTLSEYLDYSPAYILKYILMEYGKENNYEVIHYGGGKTSSEEDSLYKFKDKFGKNTKFDFYLGKKIWNKNIYNELSQKTENYNSEFFPAYRS